MCTIKTGVFISTLLLTYIYILLRRATTELLKMIHVSRVGSTAKDDSMIAKSEITSAHGEYDTSTTTMINPPNRRYTIMDEEGEAYCDDDNPPLECCICIENMKEGQLQSKLPCGHEFHSICINAWLVRSKVCPLCKDVLTKRSLRNQSR